MTGKRDTRERARTNANGTSGDDPLQYTGGRPAPPPSRNPAPRLVRQQESERTLTRRIMYSWPEGLGGLPPRSSLEGCERSSKGEHVEGKAWVAGGGKEITDGDAWDKGRRRPSVLSSMTAERARETSGASRRESEDGPLVLDVGLVLKLAVVDEEADGGDGGHGDVEAETNQGERVSGRRGERRRAQNGGREANDDDGRRAKSARRRARSLLSSAGAASRSAPPSRAGRWDLHAAPSDTGLSLGRGRRPRRRAAQRGSEQQGPVAAAAAAAAVSCSPSAIQQHGEALTRPCARDRSRRGRG